jgi:hypothetical protein
MHSHIANEIWSELKRYVNTVDRSEAAETLVSILIDNDEDPETIRDTFKHDSDIKLALTSYLDDNSFDEEEEEEEYIDEDDYNADDEW